jgi:hypothetical protein
MNGTAPNNLKTIKTVSAQYKRQNVEQSTAKNWSSCDYVAEIIKPTVKRITTILASI